MHPIICKLGPVTIYSYGLMLVVAFGISTWLLSIKAEKQGIGRSLIFNTAFTVFIFGVLGARAFYVIENLTYYLEHPLQIIMLQHGGLSWFGGLTAGIISAIFYLKKNNLSVYKILDLAMPFLALAQALGRIGCLLNGCCFGKPSPYGLYYAVHNQVLVPVQVYSSLVLLSIFIFLRIRQEKKYKQGEIFYLYLLLYSFQRFFMEFLRNDNPEVFLGLTLFQLISIALLIFALLEFIRIKNLLRKNA